MKKNISKMILVACMAAFHTGTLSAQDEPSPLVTVRIIEVMPGKNAEFVELQRQFSEALKKAGQPGRSIWQEARGNTSVFHIVNDAENFAELDETNDRAMSDTDWANWLNRMGEVTKSRQVLTLRTYPEAYIAPKKGTEPNLLRLNLVSLSSRGDATAYTNWVIDKLTPAQRKAGGTGRTLSRVIAGDSVTTVVSGRRYSSWAELDAPNTLSKLSSEARAEIFGDLSEIDFQDVKSLILRYRAELSFKRD